MNGPRRGLGLTNHRLESMFRLLGRIKLHQSRMRIAIIGLFVAPLLASLTLQSATPTQELEEAIGRVKEAPNYSWDIRGWGGGGAALPSRNGAVNSFPPADRGQVLKDGTIRGTGATVLLQGRVTTLRRFESLVVGSNPVVRFIAAGVPGPWISLVELGMGDRESTAVDASNRDLAQFLSKFKAPLVVVSELLNNSSVTKDEAGVYTAAVKEEPLKQFLEANDSVPANPYVPGRTNLTGSVIFVVTNGLIARYEIIIRGVSPDGRGPAGFSRSRIVEISNVGSSKIEVPPEAMEKANDPLPGAPAL